MTFPYDPKAPKHNVSVIGNARFTFLTSRFVRMEWAETGDFIDHATFTVVNRRMPAVNFRKTTEREGSLHILGTSDMELRFTDNGRPFDKGNLQIAFAGPEAREIWNPGSRDRANLKGTFRTLDGCDGGFHYSGKTKARRPLDLGNGLLSRSGWSVIDDSRGILLIPEAPLPGGEGKHWFEIRPETHRHDWYFLAYGRCYREALGDASRVFGAQPLPPRYALGYWWSRYWAYTDKDFEEMVGQFDRMGLPLDVLVVDMDWHLAGWTGYSWNRHYFPDPEDFLRWVKAQGVRVTLNLHPADGVGRHEDMFAEMARELGRNPQKTDRIPFDCTDPAFMAAYFKYLHYPKERLGVDFWWMDWQQGTATAVPELDPLPWLNILHWEDAECRPDNRRPLIFSRYGGLGSGRYPVGFSGDTYSTWESLAYQPYFTSTASNVLYGYWSHDLGGHMPGYIEPELYTRWIQFGVFSPILRTHTTKNPEAERRTWEYPDPHNRIMREAIIRRYEMIPYIYTENRKAAETGVSLCRPLYYDWPEEPDAYESPGQYLFGDQMMAAPVTRPSEEGSGTAPHALWVPPGSWIDTAVGIRHEGPGRLDFRYALEEIPVFVRPGAVIPGQQGQRRLSSPSIAQLVVTVWPGREGEYLLYEDDGISSSYLREKAAWIRISQGDTGDGKTVELALHKGGYPGFLSKKSLEIRLPMSAPPRKITVDDREISWQYRLGESGWTYLGKSAETVIRYPRIDLRKGARVRIYGDPGVDPGLAEGIAGLLTRLNLIRYYTTLCSAVRPLHPEETLPVGAAQTGNRISRNPGSFQEELRKLGETVHRIPAVIRGIRRKVKGTMPEDPKRPLYLKKALETWKQMEKDFRKVLGRLSP